MSGMFHVGEVAIYCHFEYWPEYNGVECEITGGLELRIATRNKAGLPPILCMSYETRASDGRHFTVLPQRLRKKKPPYDGRNVGHWAECPWQPERLIESTQE